MKQISQSDIERGLVDFTTTTILVSEHIGFSQKIKRLSHVFFIMRYKGGALTGHSVYTVTVEDKYHHTFTTLAEALADYVELH
jgi:hypothetical protein